MWWHFRKTYPKNTHCSLSITFPVYSMIGSSNFISLFASRPWVWIKKKCSKRIILFITITMIHLYVSWYLKHWNRHKRKFMERVCGSGVHSHVNTSIQRQRRATRQFREFPFQVCSVSISTWLQKPEWSKVLPHHHRNRCESRRNWKSCIRRGNIRICSLYSMPFLVVLPKHQNK